MDRSGYTAQLGRVEYLEAWDLQQGLAQARQAGAIPDVLLLLEHPPTYTIGRSGRQQDVLLTEDELARRGIAVYEVDRGGEVTYHGPGQMIGYPILDLQAQGRDVHRYLRGLEEVLIQALADLGIASDRWPGYTGVWVGQEKIAAIGVHISRWVTWHGFALNLNTDLSYFDHIIPCGIPDKGVTSVARLLGRPVSWNDFARAVLNHFSQQFHLTLQEISPEEVLSLAAFVPAARVGENA